MTVSDNFFILPGYSLICCKGERFMRFLIPTTTHMEDCEIIPGGNTKMLLDGDTEVPKRPRERRRREPRRTKHERATKIN